ncbi:MAG TPA: hypothetical protein VMF03_20635 [Steroidobacteraceae bacterium]|nr:hypothetical protein [Steroidobacteraceae bacterium]
MASRYLSRDLLAFTVLAALAACKSVPPGSRDVLDDRTGATVTVVGAPITFSRPADARSSHNYLTLDAIQKDDAGKYSEFLLLYRWSAYYGKELPSAGGATAGELIIDVDGHSVKLTPLERLPEGLPKPEVLFVPATNAALRAYAVEPDTLKLIASSHAIDLSLPDDSPDTFLLWQDGRPALQEFLKHLSQ